MMQSPVWLLIFAWIFEWPRRKLTFFKDGSSGSVLPVEISGPRSNPDFGLELRRHDKPAGTKRMALR
jgi:hypothetical protein